MKALIFSMFAVMSFSASAQFTVAPYGSSGAGAPPVGEDRSSQCGAQGCLEVKIQPYCFGTNLRAYDASKQLRPNESVVMNIEFRDSADSSKKDNFKIEFPATLTYPSGGVRSGCAISNPNATGSVRNVSCLVPGVAVPVNYQITNWKLNKNPSCYANGGSHGQEYCDYAAVQMNANRVGGGSGDSEIKCLYKFSNNYKVINNAVSCYFPSQVPDLSSTVKVFNSAGQDISGSTQMDAFVNSINFKFSQAMNSRSQVQAVKHGKVIAGPAPKHKISYTQGGRDITSIVESEKFDKANANNSFTAIVKFPGQEGFCGGFYSPLMMFFDDKTPEFSGVSTFPLYGVKEGARVYWPEQNSAGYFLVLLGKDSKEVKSHSQLFGKNDKYENGFEALKEHDSNKDGKIDSKDSVFSSLVLWNDKNGNGQSEADELVSLNSKGVESIDLKYSTRDITKFDTRARAREKSKFSFKSNGKLVSANIYDVWLAPID